MPPVTISTVRILYAVVLVGLVSRSAGCVSFMTAQYLNVTYKAETKPIELVSMVTYMLQQKFVIVVTSLTKLQILHHEILEVQKVGENYQLALQVLNN